MLPLSDRAQTLTLRNFLKTSLFVVVCVLSERQCTTSLTCFLWGTLFYFCRSFTSNCAGHSMSVCWVNVVNHTYLVEIFCDKPFTTFWVIVEHRANGKEKKKRWPRSLIIRLRVSCWDKGFWHVWCYRYYGNIIKWSWSQILCNPSGWHAQLSVIQEATCNCCLTCAMTKQREMDGKCVWPLKIDCESFELS